MIIMKTLKKRIWIIIAVIAAILAASWLATKLIYDAVFCRYEGSAQVPAQLTELVQSRQVCSFPSGDNLLTGYLYRSASAGALVVLAPGFHAGGDDYLWQIKALVDRGWSVFAYDATGSCRSQGSSAVGFPQSALDMDAALKYVEKCQSFGYNDIVLLGHSQGGYAAGCALDSEYEIAAAVTVGGINSAMEGIMEYAGAYVGPLAYGNYGFLWLYQAMLFGPEAVNAQAARTIGESGVPTLVIHGSADTRVPAGKGSILSHKGDLAGDHVTALYWDDPDSGHTQLLFDPDGTANEELMDVIHAFLRESIKK